MRCVNLLLIITLVLLNTKGYTQKNGTPFKINGTIKDVNGQSLPGVSITVKNSPRKGTSTDVNGNFSLEVNTGNVLLISFVGFATKELPVGSKTSNLAITLEQTS
ncbi:MAG: carboxypeptidase-like regulatory domain-containing protein [Ginsengibacter sp.]